MLTIVTVYSGSIIKISSLARRGRPDRGVEDGVLRIEQCEGAKIEAAEWFSREYHR